MDRDTLVRYSKQILLQDVGEEGQILLASSSVLVVGAGGLGSPVLFYLAAAGVGHIAVADPDVVDRSNLQRQILHETGRIGQNKAMSAAIRLRELNPQIMIEPIPEAVTSSNAATLINRFDVIMDGSDNLATRYLLDDVCSLLCKPWVHGAISRFEGQVTVFNHRGGPRYRDLFPEEPPPGVLQTQLESGVMGVVPGIIGCIQANEALKILLGIGTSLSGRLLHLDALEMKFREIEIRRDSAGVPPTLPHPSNQVPQV